MSILNSLYVHLARLYRPVRNAVLEEKIKTVVGEVDSIILNECNELTRKPIIIFQHSYYTRDGKDYISGGGERYATDLSEIIYSNGFLPVLVQLGDEKANKCWVNTRGKLLVVGLNVEPPLYSVVINRLSTPMLAIYSGFVNFGEKLLHPNIMISHGVTWDNPAIDVNVDLLKTIFEDVDEVVSVDTNTISWLRATYAKSLSETKKKMTYIPNYTDLKAYFPDESKKKDGVIKVIFPRRCSPERGFWLIADVLPEIMDKYSNVEFDFVGFVHTDDIGKKIEELLTKYPNRVHHLFVDADDMYKVYQNADITLIPTLYCEGTSLSCIEAMACGNVVIATNIGGLPNLIINGFNGMLIDPSREGLLNALDEVIANNEYMHAMSENALNVVKVFGKDRWIEEWDRIIKNRVN